MDVHRKACGCTPDTAVRALCDTCQQHRKTVINRLKQRARRARKAQRSHTPGTITLTADQAQQIVGALADINALQLAVLDRLALSGQPLRPDTAALFRAIAELRTAIQPTLATAEEERIEQKRPRNWKQAQARVTSDLDEAQLGV